MQIFCTTSKVDSILIFILMSQLITLIAWIIIQNFILWNLKIFAETNRFKCIYENVWKRYRRSNPPWNACITLLRNNDAKIEKRFAFEISKLWVKCRALRSPTYLRNNVESWNSSRFQTMKSSASIVNNCFSEAN